MAWLALAGLVILTAAALRYYLPLARRVWVLRGGAVDDGWVRLPDFIVFAVLALWLASQSWDAFTFEGERVVEFRHLVGGGLVYLSILLFLIGFLVYRDVPLSRVFGWSRIGFGAALGMGLLALAAAYPLIILVQAMVSGAAGGEMDPQAMVQFLVDADSLRDRLAVLFVAVVVAPVAEEVIFRGYLYPVAKRVVGPFAALIGTSLLFALLHAHAGSIPALTMLAVCLGLAYEKSGSLLVPMIMHAVFNAVSVAAILLFL